MRPNGGRNSFTQCTLASKRLQELAAMANSNQFNGACSGTGDVGGDKIAVRHGIATAPTAANSAGISHIV